MITKASPTIDLQGQVAIVTGASSGIGEATAVLLAAAGADVGVLYGKNSAAAAATAAAIASHGRRVEVDRADLRSPEQALSAVDSLAERLGGVDILVNNAGALVSRTPIQEMDLSTWNDIININLTSVFIAVRGALRHFRSGARIVNVSSIAADTGGGPHAFAYAAAKGGIVSLTRALARELAPKDIRVNAISPGYIATPLHDKMSNPAWLEEMKESIVLRRPGMPVECASAVLFLVSPLAAFVTGEVLRVNGGQYFA